MIFSFEFWLSVIVVLVSFFIGYYCAKEENSVKPLVVIPAIAAIAVIEVFRFVYL